MKKILPVLLVIWAGCNYGTSIADSPHGSSPPPSGGATGSGGSPGNGGAGGTGAGGLSTPGAGGTTAMGVGGTTGSTVSSSGGTTGGGTGGTTTGSGGTAVSGAGGTTTGLGGTTAAAGGSGGRVGGSGGAGTPDAGATGGTTGGGDAAVDARRTDGPNPGSGGAPSTGGTIGTGGSTGSGGASGTGGSTAACVPAATPGRSGMNTGQACLSCHKSGGAASSRIFTAAGSLYSTATGGSAVSGATITITDANNQKVTIVTGSDGNFYTTTSIAFPATVQASKCPDTQSMTDSLGTGDCNSCHNSTMRVHLP